MCAVQSSPVPGVTVIEAYIYDADGQRVEKGQVSTFSCNMATNGYKAEHAYALGQSGEQITEVDGSGNWLHTNVYAAGKLFASYDQNGNSLNFQLTDWVGTRRVQTNYAGAPEASFQSLPFGSRLISISATDCTPDQDCYPADMTGTPLHFTGKQRDTESGLDYFGARYYSSTSGRFISPDWSTKEEAVPYAKLGDPQTLNLYAYVGNNPLTSIDIDGHRSLAAGSPQGCAGNGSVGCSPSEQEAFTPDANTKAQQQSSSQTDAKTAKINSRAQSQYNNDVPIIAKQLGVSTDEVLDSVHIDYDANGRAVVIGGHVNMTVDDGSDAQSALAARLGPGPHGYNENPATGEGQGSEFSRLGTTPSLHLDNGLVHVDRFKRGRLGRSRCCSALFL